MTRLPRGWAPCTLAELLAEPLMNGRSVTDRPGGFPVLRLTAIRDGRVDVSRQKEGAWSESEARRFLVREGDLLVVRGNGSLDLVGRGGLVGPVEEPVAFPDTLIRVRPDTARVDRRYLALVWDSDLVRRQLEGKARTTAGIYKINQTHLRDVTIPLPELQEQRRIIEILEGHLSHLDAASAYIDAALRRNRLLVRAVLLDAIPDVVDYPARWRAATVGEAGHVELGRQRHPDWHRGSNMRAYLRVANVFEDRIDTTDLKEMHWPGDTFERFRLRPGDVLLNEGQSPELLGRPALYRGEPDEIAFTNSLIRFVARDDVRPEFALLVFRRHMHAGRFQRESRITTNIAHLSASRLRSVEFPIPPLPEQDKIVSEVALRLDALSSVNAQTRVARARGDSLRRAVLGAAFSGGLTGHSSDLDLDRAMALA